MRRHWCLFLSLLEIRKLSSSLSQSSAVLAAWLPHRVACEVQIHAPLIPFGQRLVLLIIGHKLCVRMRVRTSPLCVLLPRTMIDSYLVPVRKLLAGPTCGPSRPQDFVPPGRATPTAAIIIWVMSWLVSPVLRGCFLRIENEAYGCRTTWSGRQWCSQRQGKSPKVRSTPGYTSSCQQGHLQSSCYLSAPRR